MALLRRSTSLLALRSVGDSRRAASLWSMLAAKYRYIRYGTERKFERPRDTMPDSILEEAAKVYGLNNVPYEKRDKYKDYYMQRKSHDKLIEHNKRIRHLDKKIKRGLYDNWDYANRW